MRIPAGGREAAARDASAAAMATRLSAAVQLEAAYRGRRVRARVTQQQESYRHAWMRYYLKTHDIEAAVALGYSFQSRDESFADALAPAASRIQAATRGILARRAVHAMQERFRQRWIEYHLAARDPAAARSLGWRPAAEQQSPRISSIAVADRRRTEPSPEKPLKASQTALKPPPRPCPASKRARLAALDFPRFLGALHVAAYHLVTGISIPRSELPASVKWGFSVSTRPQRPSTLASPRPVCRWQWVTFFFILSGFVLTFSKAQQRTPAPSFTYRSGEAFGWLWKRLLACYPLFVLSLVLAKWGSALHTQPLGFWLNLLPMLAMLQSWATVVHCSERVFLCSHTAWNEPAWFVSSLFFHWLLFPLIYRSLARTSLACCTCCLALLLGLSWWELFLWPRLAGLSADRLELVGVLAARHPLANLYKFVIGCVLARLFLGCHLLPGSRSGPSSTLQLAARYVATPTAAAIGVLFWRVDPDALAYREAVTVALYSLLIVGLACGADPLARALSWRPLAWSGGLSYAVYMLHSSVMAFVSNLTANSDWTRDEAAYVRAFFPVLLGLSVLAHYGVEAPVSAYYRRPPRWWGCCSCPRRPQQRQRRHQGAGHSALTATSRHSSNLAV